MNLESQILNLQSNSIYFALMIKISCKWNLRKIKTTNQGDSYCHFHIISYKLRSFIFLKPATHQVLEHHERVHWKNCDGEQICALLTNGACMSLIKFEIELKLNFYVFICNKKQLNLMICTWLCASFLIKHFCICVPDKIFCVWDLFWIGQFGTTNSHCLMFFHVFSDFPINSLASIFTAKKSYHLEWQRTLLVSVIMRIWLQYVFGFCTYDTAQAFEYTGLCSLGASNFVSGKDNLNFFWTGSQENYFGLVVRQNNPKFQGRHILK